MNYSTVNEKDHFSWKEVGLNLKKASWALVMPIIVLGSIYAGITTPTEAAVIASIYSIVIGMIVYKDVKLKDLFEIIKNTIELSAMIYAVVMASALFGFIITLEQLPQHLLAFVINEQIGPNMFLILLNVVIFVTGFFLGPAAIIVMMVPVIVPIATSLGINLVHLGILMTVNMELAFITPPVGTNLYVLSSVARIPVTDVIKGIFPFIIIMCIALIVITFVPQITLCFVH